MQKFDRILGWSRCGRTRFVPKIDHRGESRRFAGAGRADHENEPSLQHDQIFEDIGHAEVFELRHLRGDVAQHHRRVAALVEHVDAKAAESGFGDREVDLQFPR